MPPRRRHGNDPRLMLDEDESFEMTDLSPQHTG